ncbi:hypothetical protein CHS0354_026835 [Potamilus streckersoni]|uniref:Exonuclease domain-containing protein n=1 Tax=Potamilus streckersoni TaxID=2493646 RepID=A0AAE0W7K7_9BIVA|nr:hypothetical protein CHS0354_026835 [Potamilus streckersoni]
MYDFGENADSTLFIFYDLETSGREPINQPVNAFFALTDASFVLKGDYAVSLEIRLNRLELPDPEAILVNRVSVSKLQREGISEWEAGRLIERFLRRVTEQFPGAVIYLTGFNSNRFDLPVLRTMLIRNGINPYISPRLKYLDILDYVRFLAFREPDFKHQIEENEDGQYVRLNLESLATRFGLLSEKQRHDSEADTLLLISLTKYLCEQYSGLLTYYLTREYPPGVFGYNKALLAEDGKVFPDNGFAKVIARERSSLLYVDLDEFMDGKGTEAVRYLNLNQSGFRFTDEQPAQIYLQAASEADRAFKGVRVSNFFPVSDCDIEQDIYRLPPDLIDPLNMKINGQAERRIENQDFRQLYRRFILKNRPVLNPEDVLYAHYMQTLEEYTKNRYVQRIKLNKTGDARYSRTFSEMYAALEALYENAGSEDTALLDDLKEYYLSSELLHLDNIGFWEAVRQNTGVVLCEWPDIFDEVMNALDIHIIIWFDGTARDYELYTPTVS